MSDQGEPAAHTGAEGGNARQSGSADGPTGPMPLVGGGNVAQGRVRFSGEPEGGHPGFSAASAEGNAPAPRSQQAFGQQPTTGPEWEAAPFDGVDSGAGDSNYAGVDLSGPAGPVRAGVPSSGNWQMPEWMREEAGEGPAGGFNLPEAETGGGKGKVVLFAVIGLVLVALLAAAAMFFLKPGGKAKSDVRPSSAGGAAGASGGQPSDGARLQAQGLPDTPLQKFPGVHSKAAGRIDDSFSGLSYPKLSSPWQVPTKKSGLMQLGWSAQQIVVTEKHGDQLWYGQLMSGVLGPAEQGMYKGPGTEHAAAVAYEQGLETRLYGFPHQSKLVASQALDLSGPGGKGWLVSSDLSYHRDGIKATGEIVMVAVVNTGKQTPAVLFMSVPNTEKKLMPDINFVVESLKLVP